MPYFSQFYRVTVRDEIVREFTNSKGEVDDMMEGLHEIRAQMAEKTFNLRKLTKQRSRKSHKTVR